MPGASGLNGVEQSRASSLTPILLELEANELQIEDRLIARSNFSSMLPLGWVELLDHLWRGVDRASEMHGSGSTEPALRLLPLRVICRRQGSAPPSPLCP